VSLNSPLAIRRARAAHFTYRKLRDNWPELPLSLTKLWVSFFSRAEKGTAMVKPFRRGVWSRVGLNAGPALTAPHVQPEMLQGRVAELIARG
jgi:hypothetical protein